jgi:hypothetical protein
MSIDSVSIEYNLVYQASATFAQPLTVYREIRVYLCILGINDNNADVRRLVKETLSLGNVGD